MARILWIEDDYYHVKGLVRPLEQEGFTVVPSTSATDAYHKVQDWRSYAAIVVDLILPLRDQRTNELSPEVEQWGKEAYAGLGLLKYMHDELRVDVPVIVLSVVANEQSQNARRLGADEVLLKRGLLPSQVREVIHEVLEERHDTKG
jgi:CheY-like chemotaxis protein